MEALLPVVCILFCLDLKLTVGLLFGVHNSPFFSQLALQKLRGWDDVDDEIKEMLQEDRSEKEEGQFTVFSLCTFRGLRWQLISIIVMMMGQQLSGINGVSGKDVGKASGVTAKGLWRG